MPPLHTAFSDAIQQLLYLGYEVYLPVGRNNELAFADGPYTDLIHCIVRKVTIGPHGSCVSVLLDQDRLFSIDPAIKILGICTFTKRLWLLPLEVATNKTCYVNKLSTLPRSSLSRGPAKEPLHVSSNRDAPETGPSFSPEAQADESSDREFLLNALKPKETDSSGPCGPLNSRQAP